ncbi:hypothetical protein [Pseudolysinimonas sp.]
MALLLTLTVIAVDSLLRTARGRGAPAPVWSDAPGTPLSAL